LTLKQEKINKKGPSPEIERVLSGRPKPVSPSFYSI